MSINLPNLLILVGAVHGITLSVLLLLSARNRRSGNVLLALLLAFYTLPLFKVTLLDLGFFDVDALPFGSFELLFGLGPSLYLYSKTVTDAQARLTMKDLAHFIPVGFELVYYGSPLYGPQAVFAFGPVVNPSHLLWMVQQVGAVVSVILYLALTNRRLWAYSKWVKGNYSDTHERTLRWLQTPVVLYTAFFVLWLSLRTVDVLRFDDNLPMQPYYPLLIFLSVSTYWIGTKGYLETQPLTTGFGRDLDRRDNRPADDPTLSTVFDDLENLMSQHKPYLDGDLSLSDLAKRLDVNPRLLSEVINTKAKMNFYDFVNRYRVGEFKQRVGQPDAPRTLLDLAHDCGFGSKATFNHVFKRETGLTPSQYRKKVANEPTESRA